MSETRKPLNRNLPAPSPITSVDVGGDGGCSIVVDGWTCWVRPEHADPLPQVGQMAQVETVNLSRILGVCIDGRWLWRLTDEDYYRERDEQTAEWEREKRERLEKDRYEMSQREAALPLWGRLRMRRFHDAGGETFELDGWGYELHICEYAAAMVADDAEKIAEHEGQASGNTHGAATFLARLVREGREDDAAGLVPAGLSPLTGSADYS